MANIDEMFSLHEMAARRHLEADTKRLQELRIIRAELQSLRKGSQVYTRIANGNTFLMTSYDDALRCTEKELKSLTNIDVNSQLNVQT